MRKYSCFRVNADLVTNEVCYPKFEYPKMGYVRSGLSDTVSNMPTDDPTRLREALDQIANALQAAVIVAGQFRRASTAVAQDAAVVENALMRAVAILKDVQRDGPL